MNNLLLHFALLAVALTMTACNKPTNTQLSETSKPNTEQIKPHTQNTSINVSGEIAGPIEIPRSEIVTKYGWNEDTMIVPATTNYYLILNHGGGSIVHSLPPDGVPAPRFLSVGKGCSFAGRDMRIGNLVIEGDFTWSDEKITLKAHSKLHK